MGGGSNGGEVVTLTDGGYMVVWINIVTPVLPIPNVTDDQLLAILGRTFNADGTPGGQIFQINQATTVSGQTEPDLAVLSNGNIVAVWTNGPDLSDGADVSARGRIFAPDGTPLTDEFDLATTTERDQDRPEVVATADGGFFAVWADGRFSNTDERWFGQQFNANGDRVGPEMHIGDMNATQNGELVAPRSGALFVYGDAGAVFDPSETYDFLAGLQRPTAITLINRGGTDPDGELEDAVAVRDDGLIAVLRPGMVSTQINLELRVVTDAEAPDATYPDGTPYPDTNPVLTNAPDWIGGVVAIRLQEVPGFGPFNSVSDLTSVAATFRPDGTLAVVWTAPSGGTPTTPEFSVFAQIVNDEGIPISERIVIEDENVRGGELFPPFVSAGEDGRLFIGWTGTTDRFGPGTNEVMGGVFDIATVTSGFGPAGWMGTDGADQPGLGEAAADRAFLLGGDDIWVQADNPNVNQVYGMQGNDRLVADRASVGGTFYGGLGWDILDYSMLTEGLPQFAAQNPNANSQTTNFSNDFEEVIGTLFHDFLGAPFANDFFDPTLRGRLHAEAGNDTIEFIAAGGEIDGGAGFDVMTTTLNRSNYVLTFQGDHYTLGYLEVPPGGTEPEVNPRMISEIRGVEEIRFADETVALQTTASRDSGAAAGGSLLPNEITGTAAANNLSGTAGADRIFGLAGADTLAGFAGNDTLNGGDGNDLAFSGPGNDSLVGGLGSDTLFGAGDNDTLDGGADDDLLGGGPGNDSMSGSTGNDAIWTAAGNDTADGGDGNDTLGGAAGNDSLSGGAGNDELWGATDNDTLLGGDGVDTLGGSIGNDSLSGGGDGDEMWGAAGNDTLSGDGGDDTVGAGAGDDSASGGDGNDQVFGGLGNDQIQGGNGNDTLYGASGNDTIDGGAGNDQIYAGPGLDEIAFSAGADTVFFFAPGQDVIDLSGVAAISDFADLQANHLAEVSGSAVISDGLGNSLTLDGVLITALAADSFLFT